MTNPNLHLVALKDPHKAGLPYSKRTLNRKIAAGEFGPVVKVGGRLYATQATIDAHLSSIVGVETTTPSVVARTEGVTSNNCNQSTPVFYLSNEGMKTPSIMNGRG